MGFFYGLLSPPPPAKIVSNVSSYHSRPYCTYGINLQAICGAAPGRAGDLKAIAKTSVPTWLES
jgi:hypothetical protein